MSSDDDSITRRERRYPRVQSSTDRDLQSQRRRRDDQATADAVIAASDTKPTDAYELPTFADDDTRPVTLIERVVEDPDSHARNRDLLDLYKKVARYKRAHRETDEAEETSAKATEKKIQGLEFRVKIMWGVATLIATLACASIITVIKGYGTSVSESATNEYRMRALEQSKSATDTLLHDALIRLRDTEESARINALHVDDLLHRAGSNNQRTP